MSWRRVAGVEIWLQSFLASALGWRLWSASRPGRFNSGEIVLDTDCIGGQMGGGYAGGEKSFLLDGIRSPDLLARSSVTVPTALPRLSLSLSLSLCIYIYIERDTHTHTYVNLHVCWRVYVCVCVCVSAARAYMPMRKALSFYIPRVYTMSSVFPSHCLSLSLCAT
jgi:hypothetical protein